MPAEKPPNKSTSFCLLGFLTVRRGRGRGTGTGDGDWAIAAADEIKDGITNHPPPPSHTHRHTHTVFSVRVAQTYLSPRRLSNSVIQQQRKRTHSLIVLYARPLFEVILAHYSDIRYKLVAIFAKCVYSSRQFSGANSSEGISKGLSVTSWKRNCDVPANPI